MNCTHVCLKSSQILLMWKQKWHLLLFNQQRVLVTPPAAQQSSSSASFSLPPRVQMWPSERNLYQSVCAWLVSPHARTHQLRLQDQLCNYTCVIASSHHHAQWMQGEREREKERGTEKGRWREKDGCEKRRHLPCLTRRPAVPCAYGPLIDSSFLSFPPPSPSAPGRRPPRGPWSCGAAWRLAPWCRCCCCCCCSSHRRSSPPPPPPVCTATGRPRFLRPPSPRHLSTSSLVATTTCVCVCVCKASNGSVCDPDVCVGMGMMLMLQQPEDSLQQPRGKMLQS